MTFQGGTKKQLPQVRPQTQIRRARRAGFAPHASATEMDAPQAVRSEQEVRMLARSPPKLAAWDYYTWIFATIECSICIPSSRGRHTGPRVTAVGAVRVKFVNIMVVRSLLRCTGDHQATASQRLPSTRVRLCLRSCLGGVGSRTYVYILRLKASIAAGVGP